jgi:hypothetical protein
MSDEITRLREQLNSERRDSRLAIQAGKQLLKEQETRYSVSLKDARKAAADDHKAAIALRQTVTELQSRNEALEAELSDLKWKVKVEAAYKVRIFFVSNTSLSCLIVAR